MTSKDNAKRQLSPGPIMVQFDETTAVPLNIDIFADLQRTKAEKENRGYGSYPRDPVRCRPIVDNLVRRAGDEVNAEFGEQDETGDQNNDPST